MASTGIETIGLIDPISVEKKYVSISYQLINMLIQRLVRRIHCMIRMAGNSIYLISQ